MATLQIRPGDTRVWTLSFVEADGDPQNLAGTTVEVAITPDVGSGVLGFWKHDGLDVTEAVVLDPDGESGGSIVVSDVTTGVMVLTLSARCTGKLDPGRPYRYTVTISSALSGIRIWDEGDVVVGPDPSVVPVPGGDTVEPTGIGTSRLQLRRDILKDLGDLRILRATSDGDNVSLIDHVSLIGEPGAYAGREVLFVGGTAENLGEIRYVTGSSQGRRSLGFGVPLPAATKLHDEAELVNVRGVGYRIQDVHEGINRVIRHVRDRALVTVPTSYPSYAAGAALPLPANLKTVEDVQWYAPDDVGLATGQVIHAVRKANRANGYGWWVDQATRTLRITGNHVATPAINREAGAILVVTGLGRPAELQTDSDCTPIDPEFLVMAVQAELARSKYLARPTPETERTMFMLNQMAGALRGKVATRRSPFSEDIL